MYGSATIAPGAIPPVGSPVAFVSALFSPPAPVFAGLQYAIVAYTGGADSYYWGFALPPGPYAGGEPFFTYASPPGSAWNAFDGDNAFKTFVVTDRDGDGLSNAAERALGTSSADLDSDDDGIADGRGEDRNGDGRTGRRETSPVRFDTDRDGLSDGLERGLTRGVADPPGAVKGTGRRFKPDRDPRSKTNPLKRDTDNSGVHDGREDKNHNGRVDNGETDPTKADDRPPRRRP